jgi:3-deoxy-manno-octulosonate cytidylyltransferase (CMP-KDO synthetase)
MTTLRKALHDPQEIGSSHVVKVVVDRAGDALYFSRAAIPFSREVRLTSDTTAEAAGTGSGPTLVGSGFSRTGTVYKHIGLYAYRRDFLLTLAALEPTPLEQAESLEQLRALEHGYPIRVVETEYDSIGVDTPDDLERARRQLRELTADAPA